MMAKFIRRISLPLLLVAFVLPGAAMAAPPTMHEISMTLLGKGLATGDIKRARRLFEEAMVADPANAAAMAALGRNYQTDNQPKLARKYYGLSLNIDPTDPGALYGSAELDIADGKPDDARDRLRKLKVVCAACRETMELEQKLGAGAPLTSKP